MPENGYATDDDVSGAFGNPLLAFSSPNMQAVYEQARRQAMQNQMAGAQSIEDQFFGGKKPEPSALDKLLGLGGTERYQTWPERMVRSAVSAPHDAMNSMPQNPVTTEQMIAPALDMAGMVMSGGLPMAERGALGAVGGRIKSKLPMDETSRLSRAQEQGYTIDAFKGGQPYHWDSLPETNGRGEIIPGTENRIPLEINKIRDKSFFSNDPNVANRFAAPYEHGAVWPVKLKFENPLVIDAKGHHAADFQFDSLAKERGTTEHLRAFKDALENGKHDGVILKNTKDEGTVYVPVNGDQVRSKFANFDPKNKGTGKLLGSGGAPLVAPSNGDDQWQPHEWMPGAFTHQGHVLVPVGDDHASR